LGVGAEAGEEAGDGVAGAVEAVFVVIRAFVEGSLVVVVVAIEVREHLGEATADAVFAGGGDGGEEAGDFVGVMDGGEGAQAGGGIADDEDLVADAQEQDVIAWGDGGAAEDFDDGAAADADA
jgi:hypothetical protein